MNAATGKPLISDVFDDYRIDFRERRFQHCPFVFEVEVPRAVEIVQHLLLLQLVDLVENDDVRIVECVPKAVEQFVTGRGLSVNIKCAVDALKDTVEGFEAGIVLPTVDVLRGDIGDPFAEPFDGISCDASLSGAAGAM